MVQKAGMNSIPKVSSGDGCIRLESYGPRAVLSDLSSSYPLKLISPSVINENVAVVYVLSYGGGLVASDCVKLSVNVGNNTILVLRSQGSTKVFKSRMESRLASVQTPERTSFDFLTTQNMTCTIASNGVIFLLPDPVTCFKSASFAQRQIFHLSENGSLLVIDWFTSGRVSMGEEWEFARYCSNNEIWVEGKLIAKDVTFLDKNGSSSFSLPPRSLSDRLSPYSCYATVLLYGPLLGTIIEGLTSEFSKISVFKRKFPEDIIWSLSSLTPKDGIIVRVAGKETETVRNWMGKSFIGVQSMIGMDVYQSTFTQ